MLLPFLGGVKQVFTLPSEDITALHYFCFLPYVLYALWAWRALSRGVMLDHLGVHVTGWLTTRYHPLDRIQSAVEILLPRRDYSAAAFAKYRPFLVLKSSGGTSTIPGQFVKGYARLKEELEQRLGHTLETVKREKSTLRRVLERIP
jgi:hypothetical protein